jgi:hypothetical protein
VLNNPLRATALTMVLALLTACSTGEPADSELDAYLCDQDDVGDQYIELTRGEFTPRDLADLSDNADSRERALTEAGMQAGRFAFYKESLPRPPFDPPVNIICQVSQFKNEASASEWVAALTATNIAESVFAGELRAVEGRVIERKLDFAPLPRAFAIYGGLDDEQHTVSAVDMFSVVVAADGRYVRTLAIGGSHYPDQIEALASVLWLTWNGP